MLAAFHHNVWAIVNPSIGEFKFTFEDFICTLRIKVAIELLRVIVIALPIYVDMRLTCPFFLVRTDCIHQAADGGHID